jgi:hypothetical protein
MTKRIMTGTGSKGKRTAKPRKPHKDFPLTWHPTGYWCKKIRGKLHDFGARYGDPAGALDEYWQVKDDLLFGRPGPAGDQLTVRDPSTSSSPIASTALRRVS